MKNKQNRSGSNNSKNNNGNSPTMKNDYMAKRKVPSAVNNVLTDQNDVQADMNSSTAISSKKKTPRNNNDQIY